MRSFIFIMGILILCRPISVYAQDECVPIITVYGGDICASDVLISEAVEENLRLSAKETGKRSDQAVEELRNSYVFRLVWERALTHKFGDKLLSVKKGEVKSYLKSYRRSAKKQNKGDRSLVKLIDGLLKENKYHPSDEQLLKALRAQAQISVEAYDMRRKADKETEEKIKASEYDVAKNAIRNWKVKKALRDEYGGEIILRDGGLEPIGAYKDFLSELRLEENLTIHNDEYKNIFKAMQRYFDQEHIVVEEGSDNIKNYFSSASWVYDKNISQNLLKELKENILAIVPIKPDLEDPPEPKIKPDHEDKAPDEIDETSDAEKVDAEMKKQISQSVKEKE